MKNCGEVNQKSKVSVLCIYRLTGLIYNPTKSIESLRLEPKKKKQKLIRWKISLVICRFVIDLIMGKIGFRDSNKIYRDNGPKNIC